MSDNETNISNSSIRRDIIGRDNNSQTFNNYFQRSNYLEELYKKFEDEKKSNPELQEICDELDYYNSKFDGDIIGLEEKLIAGNREKMIFYATSVKEQFRKKLMKTSQLSLAAQEINIHILAKVRRGFMSEIYNRICNNEPQSNIDQLITERIVNPVMAELGLNIFHYNEDEVMGMIYFLTGNCHLKWN
jgi:hypothetical protein